jgi:cytochrome c-type biogenesis protein CcmI
MIMTWGVPVAVAALCGLWIAWPFLRRGLVEPNDADQAISIYRDQIDELRRDFDNGLINEADLDAARQEIEARALAAAGDLGGWGDRIPPLSRPCRHHGGPVPGRLRDPVCLFRRTG